MTSFKLGCNKKKTNSFSSLNMEEIPEWTCSDILRTKHSVINTIQYQQYWTLFKGRIVLATMYKD